MILWFNPWFKGLKSWYQASKLTKNHIPTHNKCILLIVLQFFMKFDKFSQPSEHFSMINRWLFWKIGKNAQKRLKMTSLWRHNSKNTQFGENRIFQKISLKILYKLFFTCFFVRCDYLGQKCEKPVFLAISYISLIKSLYKCRFR